jgi:hypothetical protein
MANATFTISYTTAPSTAITLTPAAPYSGSGTSFTAAAPVPAATVVGQLSVSPPGWAGVLALSGPIANHYTLNALNQLVTAVATTLPAIDTLVVTATP